MRHSALLFVAALIPAALTAQTGCPANIRAIPLHKLSQHQMVVGVSINHSGPYDFLLDTGTQMTVIDLRLAGDLHLMTTGNANVAGVSFQGSAWYSRVDSIQVGDRAASSQGVMVYDMKKLQSAGFPIRGLLGADFLSRYDVIIDKTHGVLCIDDTGAMLGALKREPVPVASSGDGGHTQGSAGAAH